MIAALQRSAFCRLLLPFVFGIFLRYYFLHLRLEIELTWIITGLLISACILSSFIQSYRLRWLFGMELTFLCAWMGILLMALSIEKSSWKIPENAHNYSLVLLEDPVLKPKTYMCKAYISGSDTAIFDDVVGKKVIAYLPKNEMPEQLFAGNEICVNTLFKPVKASEANGFDYAVYLEKQGFSSVGYMASTDGITYPTYLPLLDQVKFQALACRRKVIEQLKLIIPDERNMAVAVALFTGYKANLSPELGNAFASVGVSHVLAVSGLHLTILFAILCFIFSPLEQSAQFRPIIRLLILLILWLFAFITGLAPSIVRACVMSSFVGMGSILERRPMTINSLAASAFFMLIYDPFYLFDVGFQLSYAAVIGIIAVNPYLVCLRKFKSRILTYFWEMACVAVSAQIATIPLSLYYFHQFPLIFILSNWFAVPLVGLLLFLIPLSVLLSMICPVHLFIFFPVNVILDFFVSGIEMFNGIPFSVWKGIFIDGWTIFILYLEIWLIMMFLFRKQMFYLYSFLLLVVLQVF